MYDKIALMGAAALAAVAGYATDMFGGGEAGAADQGRIYHYVRSNQDGSDAENVYVYRAADNKIELYRTEGQCSDADYATVWLDQTTGRALVANGGRLMPEARHENFRSIAYDGVSTTLRAESALPDRMARGEIRIENPVFHLYDFDLATLSLQTMALDDPRAGFSFALPVMTANPNGGELVRNLGTANAEFVAEEEFDGRAALRFEVGGEALGDNGGPLWIDAASGHVLGAEWGIPNRAGMENFALRLIDTNDSGEGGWDALLRAHFEGCSQA